MPKVVVGSQQAFNEHLLLLVLLVEFLLLILGTELGTKDAGIIQLRSLQDPKSKERTQYIVKVQDTAGGMGVHLQWPTSLTGKGGEGGELQVWIKEAKNLTAAKSGGTSDSFVKG